MTIRCAQCHCGGLQLECVGDPRKISMCHCLDCQRRTGSAFSVAVFYERDCVRLAAGSALGFERPSASGFPVTFRFCGDCGTNLWWEPARLPDLIGVALGAFADPAFPRPDQSVWTEEKHHWLTLPEDMPAFDRNPSPRR